MSRNVANYRSLFGLPAKAPTVVVDGNDPGTGSEDEVEALLDLEVASAIAPGASLTLYTAQDTTFQSGLFLAIQRALDDNAINILNVSFGGCEAYEGQSGNQETLNFWEQAAAQGISVTVSTGDSGSAGCDNSNTETSAAWASGQRTRLHPVQHRRRRHRLQPDHHQRVHLLEHDQFAASVDPPSARFRRSPGTTRPPPIGALSANVPTEQSAASTIIAGAGGGFSNLSQCQRGLRTAMFMPCPNSAQAPGFYAKPSWQSSFGTQNARELPDVSLFASDGRHDSAWVLCASGLGDSTTGTDCTPDASGQFSFQVVGGTSASSPAFAGMLSLVINNLQNGGAQTSASVRRTTRSIRSPSSFPRPSMT